jgi:hypothetical protein
MQALQFLKRQAHSGTYTTLTGAGLNPACRFQIIFFSSSPLSDLADAVLTNYVIGLQGQSGGRGAPTFWRKLGTETDGISDCPNKFYNVFKMILCMG